MVGMRDVARQAGVSLSTVSLVVNGTGYVSDEMRVKVERAMKSLNYVPNELARNLYRNRTDTIGVIVPTIRHPFFASLVSSLQRVFAAQGRRTMLCSTADADKGEAEYVDMLRRHMMDGIIMAAHTVHPADYWTSIGRPLVAFDRVLGEGIPSVGSDHEAAGELIARALIDSGARHVVTVGGPRSQFGGGETADGGAARDAGCDGHAGDGVEGGTFPTVRYHLTAERLLREAGVRCDYVEAGEVSALSDHAAAARRVFDQFDDVDAIVGSDLVAAYCVQEALRRGIDVPGDLQLIAYDGTYMADAAGMRLSAIVQDVDAIAERLGACMDRAIAGNVASAGGDGTAADGDSAPENGVSDLLPVTYVPADTTR